MMCAGEPQDELLHDLRPEPGAGVHGGAVSGQELPQAAHLQAGAPHAASELHGSARHRQGLHRHHRRNVNPDHFEKYFNQNQKIFVKTL